MRFCCLVAAIKLANKETERAYSLRCDFALDFVERGDIVKRFNKENSEPQVPYVFS